MSKISVGGGKLSFLVTNSSLLSSQSLQIGDFNLNSQPYVEAIESFHTAYMNNTRNIQSSNIQSKEYIITYYTRYIEELVKTLNDLNDKYKNDLPFKEMATILRAVQGFGIDCSMASSIISLRNEIYKEKDEREKLDLTSNFNKETFYELIKRGDLLNAKKYFTKHPNYRSSAFARNVENSLQPSDRIFGYMNRNDEDFIQKFLTIKRQSEGLARTIDVKNDFREICPILAGDLEYFMSLKPNWLEFIIFLCLFRDGIIRNPVETKNEIIQKFGSRQQFSELESIFLEAFIDNMHGLAQKLSGRFPSFFTAHLIDILSTLGKLDTNPQDEFEQMNYPEYYFLNFINEIITNKSISTELVCDYIYLNLGGLETCEDLLIYSNSIRFQVANTERLVKYFKSLKLEKLIYETYKLASLNSLQAGYLSRAVEFAIKSSNLDLKTQIQERVLQISSNEEINDDLIRVQVRSMNPNYLNDSSVMHFLSSYIKYVDLVNSADLKEAGIALVRFFDNERAPAIFYERILTRSTNLFDRGLVLSSSNFFKVLKAYEKMSMMSSTSQSSIQQVSFTLGQASSLSLLNSS